MAAILRGNTTGPVYQSEYTVHQAPDGSGESRLSYTCSTGSPYAVFPTPLTAHPFYPTLLCYESEITLLPGEMVNIASIFKGVLAAEPEDLAQYEFNLTAVSQPIETHPLFSQPTSSPPVTSTDLAKIQQALDTNTAPSGLSSAAATLLYNKKLRGIDSFYGPSAQFKVNFCSVDIPNDYTNVGYIDPSPAFPSGFTPSIGTYQNWLQIGYSWRKAAGVVSITQEWQLSGIAGWDVDLYQRP